MTPRDALGPVHRSTLFTLCLAFVLAFTTAAPAQEPELVTDRPDQTESAEVVPPGRVQLEAGWTFTRDDVGPVRLEIHELPGTLLRLGLARRFELRLGWAGGVWADLDVPGQSTASINGVGDAEVGAKILLAEERGAVPQAALLVGASVPVGSREFTSDRADPNFRLSLAHTLSDRLSLGYNLGMEWETGPEGPDGDRDTLSSALYTVALGIGLGERLGAFVEIFGDAAASGRGHGNASFDGGFTWLVRDNLQLDAAAGFGISEDAPDWFVGLGVSVRWPR